MGECKLNEIQNTHMWRIKHKQHRSNSKIIRLDTKIRDLGKMAFIDLRDEFGITQIIIGEELQEVLKELTTESAITVEGTVEKGKM